MQTMRENKSVKIIRQQQEIKASLIKARADLSI